MNSWDAAKELNWKFLIEKEKILVLVLGITFLWILIFIHRPPAPLTDALKLTKKNFDDDRLEEKCLIRDTLMNG